MQLAPEDIQALPPEHPLCGTDIIRCPVCFEPFHPGERVALRSFQRLEPASANWQAVVMHAECILWGLAGRGAR